MLFNNMRSLKLKIQPTVTLFTFKKTKIIGSLGSKVMFLCYDWWIFNPLCRFLYFLQSAGCHHDYDQQQ